MRCFKSQKKCTDFFNDRIQKLSKRIAVFDPIATQAILDDNSIFGDS